LQSGALRTDGSAFTGPSGFPVTALTGTASDAFPGSTYWGGAGTTWSITDNSGSSAEANQFYKAGGPFPPMTCLASMADRLIGALGNTVYVSSFTPLSLSGNPVPQWPAIAIESADGWQFDISSSPVEQIQTIVTNEPNEAYILSNQRVKGMRSLAPGTVPYAILDKGCIGRQAAIYANNALRWAAPDGIYSANNGAQWEEDTKAIRIYIYKKQFAPDSSLVLAYQDRKLWAFEGAKYLRLDFTANPPRWTSGTFADSVVQAFSFSMNPGSAEQIYLLCATRFVGRMLSACFADMQIGTTATGTAPPDWVYTSGFDFGIQPYLIKGVEVDTSGLLSISQTRMVSPLKPMQARAIGPAQPIPNQDETWYPGAGDFAAAKMGLSFTAANSVSLIRALWERSGVDRKVGTT